LCVCAPFVTPLHKVMTGAIVVKIVVLTVLSSYWVIFAATGASVGILDQLRNFLFTVSETCFFFLLYLYAKGWRTVRAGLPTLELRTTLVALLVLLLTLLFFTFYNTEYYWLSLIVVYFFLLPKFFSSMSHNTRVLEGQIAFFQRTTNPPTHVLALIDSLTNKVKAFARVRVSVIVYLVIVVLVNALFKALLSFMWDYSWFPVLMNEVSAVTMVTFVCYVLVPRNNGLWLTGPADLIPLVRAQHFITHRDDEDDDDADDEPWDLKKTVLVVWPSANSPSTSGSTSTSSTSTTSSPSTRNKSLLESPMSLAFEEKYIKEQEEIKRKQQ